MDNRQIENALLPHHAKSSVCISRAKYRNPGREKAVKVYTINLESQYLLIQNVPALEVTTDLRHLCEQYGIMDKFQVLKDFPCEDFTQTCLVKYRWFPAARTAKKQLDEKSFFGALLHVCYAPEYETTIETREKLGERRKYIASRRQFQGEKAHSTKQDSKTAITFNPDNEIQRSVPCNLIVKPEMSEQAVTYIWAGKEYTIFPSQQPSSSASSEYYHNDSNAGCKKHSSVITMELNVKKRISKLDVPNSRVSFKRRKRI